MEAQFRNVTDASRSGAQLASFTKVFSKLLKFYDRRRGIQWKWSSLDSAMVKAPKGGDLTGPNPTDRAKSGVKRHILTDGRGVPLAAEITGANLHDKWLVGQMLDAVVLRAPAWPSPSRALLSRQRIRLHGRRGRRPRPPDLASHQAHRRAAAPGLRPGQASQMGRGADQRMAQPLPRAARALGTNRRPLPRSSSPCLRAHRVPPGPLTFSGPVLSGRGSWTQKPRRDRRLI